jgi:acetolactate synthase small subunit
MLWQRRTAICLQNSDPDGLDWRNILKFIGKESQRKIDLQIQGLQEQVKGLEQALRSNEFVLIGAGNELAELKPQYSKLLTSNETLELLLLVRASEIDALKTRLEEQQAQQQGLMTELKAFEAASISSKAESDNLKANQAASNRDLQAQIDKLNQDWVISQKALKDAESQLSSSRAEADALRTNLSTGTQQLKEQLNKLMQELAVTQQKHKDAEKALSLAKAHAEQSAKVKTEAEQATHKALAQTKVEVEGLRQDLKKLAVEKDSLISKLDHFQTMSGTADGIQKASIDTKLKLDAKQKELTKTKADRDKLSKQIKQVSAKYEDSHQENGLLLLQLMQAQEELSKYHEEKIRFEQLYEAYKNRWTRLESRFPHYVDFGVVELLTFDSVSEVPSITWRVKDYAQSGVALPEFLFQTVLQQGQPGICLVTDTQTQAKDDSALVPKLMASSTLQLGKFLHLSSSDYSQLTSAASILSQLEATQWQSVEVPADFDPNFWRPSLKVLSAQWLNLPPVLRYDAVKLKRELINPDYEHLWVELHGMSYGTRSWKKFETRLGAALVQDGGFSLHPKFEIPLIDGKNKPFDSWYAESHDEAGAKLELRFSLEKNIFDAAVLAKLSEADRLLVIRLIYLFPEVLKRLETQHDAIHRPWATWIDFAARSVAVLELQKKTSKKLLAPQEFTRVVSEPAALRSEGSSSPYQSRTSRSQNPRSSGPKVISIGSKAPVKRPVS